LACNQFDNIDEIRVKNIFTLMNRKNEHLKRLGKNYKFYGEDYRNSVKIAKIWHPLIPKWIIQSPNMKTVTDDKLNTMAHVCNSVDPGSCIHQRI
jgi:hypothetical protein